MTDAAKAGSAPKIALPKGTTDVFISYSRKDIDFVRRLSEAIQVRQRDTWVDWASIAKGEKWWQEIQRGIEGTNTFAFVLSPDSVASKVCRDEIDHAVQCKKRLVPIVFREGFAIADVHPALQEINWLFCRETDDFESALQSLLETIDTDLDYVKLHTRLLQRAIDWDNKQRDTGAVLRGQDLTEAQQWFQQGKTPRPTELQVEYLQTSLAVQKADQVARRIVRAGFVGLGAIVAAAIGAVIVTQQRIQENERQSEQKLALADVRLVSTAAEGAFLSGQVFESLLVSLQAGQQLKQLDRTGLTKTNLQTQVIAALWQAMNVVSEHNTLTGHQEAVWSVSFSPDGKTLASSSGDNTIKLWDVATGKALQTLTGHQDVVTSVRFSPDGKTLASGSGDKIIKLWDVATGKALQTFTGHQSLVISVSFSPAFRDRVP
ncbi:hypothetical protein C7B82_20520 [Stenomitos frigidus ULC18]|uniref:TIR domain-containing protein n=2 Tax=Stenomitos TaxID=1844270 RepID=A0A2T1E0C1_9CYAN|nr:hypothetical protein C7B82_20520 [Stenomitos frigidus ULC18]